MANLTGFAFENFSLTSPGTATTENIEYTNTRSFEIVAFRAVLSTGTGTVNFYETIDGLNKFSRKIYHVEANNFVSTVAGFSAGHFVGAVAGMADFQIEKVTAAASTTLNIIGRAAFGSGVDGGISASAGPDDKEYIDFLDGTKTVRVHLVDIGTTTSFSGTFPSLTTTVANDDIIATYGGSFSAVDFQFRDPRVDVFNYVSPDSRPVLRAEVTGDATNTSVEYGFKIDISAIDFADAIGIGFSVYDVSNYDYASNSGLLHPVNANRNYATTLITIRDSAGAKIWQANKLDIAWNGTAPEQTDEILLDTNATNSGIVTAGTASAVYVKTRYTPTIIGTSWTNPGDSPKPRHHVGDIVEYRHPQSKWIELEFSLERDQSTDSVEGYYQSPTGYDIDGEPWTLGTPSGAITWDFSDAATLYIYRQLTVSSGVHGRSLSSDMADTNLSNAGGEGFPNPPSTSPNPEIQLLYWKDVYLRRRPFEYAKNENYSVYTP